MKQITSKPQNNQSQRRIHCFFGQTEPSAIASVSDNDMTKQPARSIYWKEIERLPQKQE